MLIKTNLLPFIAVNFQRLRHELRHVTDVDGGNAGEESGKQSGIALARAGPEDTFHIFD